MKITNRHERIVAAPPEQVAALIADFGAMPVHPWLPAPPMGGLTWRATCQRPAA